MNNKLLLCVLLVWAPSCFPAQIEEILASAPNRCGPWPLRHIVTRSCEYPVLKTETDNITYALRIQLLPRCLICSGQICELRTLPVEDRRTCRTVFTTPRRIISLSTHLAEGKREFDARFNYDINLSGRIENIELLETAGMPPSKITRLIEEGAALVRYRPIATESGPVSVVKLTAGYVMQVRD